MPAPTPRMHGLTHIPGGSDPIPGLTFAAGYPGAVLTHPCLIHYWPADEASGDLVDRKGTGNLVRSTHSYSGVTWPRYGQPGPTPDGGSVENDGLQGAASSHTGRFAYTIPAPLWAAAAPFTVECWIYPTAYPSSGAGMLLQIGPGSTGDYTAVFVQTNKLYFGHGSATSIATTADLPLNVWHHVAARFNGTTLALFLDGAQVATGAGDTTAPAAGSLGYLNTVVTGVDPFRGRSAHLALYNCALSDAEIAAHYALRDIPPPTAAEVSAKVDRDAVEAAAARLVQVKLLAGDTQPAFKILGNGQLQWGPGGTTVFDTALYRSGVGILKSDAFFRSSVELVARDGTSAQTAIGQDSGGRAAILFSTDTKLYRDNVNVVKTDGTLTAQRLAGRIGSSVAISGGVITVSAGVHRVSAGGTLHTINGGFDGAFVVLTNRSGANITISGAGNIAGSTSVFTDGQAKMFVYEGTANLWQVIE